MGGSSVSRVNVLGSKGQRTEGEANHSGRTIVMVYNCFKEVIVFNNRTTRPPPSTVSMVLASRLGVIASKSWSIHIPYVFPRILSDSL